ncbi:tyrosine-type recombinase/integrase [Candidatus Thiodictyon syntrophicum]|jgi:site-specific recombinase XerD|uniref:Integrase n=1 Tax=Candidatus Thiodictyon syntrophicum TaxID=1166950 RepID=A0A2K8UJC1_9GAMM|nr:tyrosine-type recombinase/integrase [Candidatus Thiodictyon syntrophicum]AUB85676.1 integrase [Candidatus Thiodictyon syntrophicum]
MNAPQCPTDLARLLQAFFCQHLMQQRGASRQTINGYRDTFRLLLRFAETSCGKSIGELALADLDAALVLAFLEDLETRRHNTVRTRNARLAAIRAFVHYAGLQEPAALPVIQRILAIPAKRFDRPVVGFLSRAEIEAILQAPDARTWSGQRDRALLTAMYNTGARVSELVAARRVDLESEHCQALHLHGKGRKERVVPLWARTTKLLRDWLARIGAEPQQPLFPNRQGQPMTRSGVASRLARSVRAASSCCPSLQDRRVSPHSVRHTTAMHLLQAGVDLTVIALWLGHESVETTHQYMEADLRMKEQALATLQAPPVGPPRFVASPTLLAFLDGL